MPDAFNLHKLRGICPQPHYPDIGRYSNTANYPCRDSKFYNQKFENGRTDGKGGLSAKAIRNFHNMLYQAMKQACINGIIINNPTHGTIIPRQEKKGMRVLSKDEQAKLLNVIHTHRLGFAILFDLATGLRITMCLTLD